MAGDYDYFEKKRERKEDGVELKKKGRGAKKRRGGKFEKKLERKMNEPRVKFPAILSS